MLTTFSIIQKYLQDLRSSVESYTDSLKELKQTGRGS